MTDPKSKIESLLKEQRVFKPSDAFAAKAHISSGSLRPSEEERPKTRRLLGRIASDLHWFESGQKCSSGICHFQMVRRWETNISSTTASTGISQRIGKTKSRSVLGKANRRGSRLSYQLLIARFPLRNVLKSLA
jgi:glucose-6-phosphate dehydrogenase assembly protein OpcA